MNENRINIRTVGYYSVIWSTIATVIILIFRSNSKLLLSYVDGISQHYIAFNYVCEYVNSFLKNGFSGMTMYNMHLGLGGDVLTTLNCYDFTDPVSIIAACITPLSRIHRFELMELMKLYLSGIGFLVFLRARGNRNIRLLLAGALSYSFCISFAGFFWTHPNFMCWSYFCPLILGGVEMYRRKGQGGLLISSICLNLVINYYTFYINICLTIVYVIALNLASVLENKTGNQLKEEFLFDIRLTGKCILGILLSSVTLFPSVYAYLNNSRGIKKTDIADLLLHSPKYLMGFFRNLSLDMSHDSYVMGLNVLVMFIFILSFTLKKAEVRFFRNLMLVCIILACFPFTGWIFNGFDYSSDRWCYFIPLMGSALLVETVPCFESLSIKKIVSGLGISAIYIVYVLFFGGKVPGRVVIVMVSVFIVCALLTSIVIIWKPLWIDNIVLICVICGSLAGIYTYYSPELGNWVNYKSGNEADIIELLEENAYLAVGEEDNEEGFYRVDIRTAGYENSEIIHRIHGTTFYWSIFPENTSRFFNELGFARNNSCIYKGLEVRTSLLELAGVKYYACPDDEVNTKPYGFEEINSADSRYRVYENQYALPMAYVQNEYIDSNEYDKLNPIDKQWAFLYGIVANDNFEGIEKCNYKPMADELDYKIKDIYGVDLSQERMSFQNQWCHFTLEVDIPCESEVYLMISNPEITDRDSVISDVMVQRSGLTNDEFCFKTGSITNPDYKFSIDTDYIVYNLGIATPAKNDIVIYSSNTNIKYNSIKVYVIPMDSYRERVEELKTGSMSNIIISNDHISGDVELKRSGILQFAIPYNRGWRAYDNGQEVDINETDMMFMGIELDKGNHNVVLTYRTPLLYEGAMVSCITMMYIIWNKKRKRNSV